MVIDSITGAMLFVHPEEFLF